jgi:hypothetical protein
MASVPSTIEETATLHQTQMLGGHRAGDAASFRELPDRVGALSQHLKHSQPMGMRESAKAFCRSLQRFQIGQLNCLGRHENNSSVSPSLP